MSPSSPNTTSVLTVAKDAAALAGEVLMRYFVDDNLEIRDKTAIGGVSHDLVSDADLSSEQIIGQRIRDAFPEHDFIGEESQAPVVDADSSEHLWIVDPLDGTNNFAHRIPQFAISIAYYHRGVATVGVIFNPATNQWFTAVKGEGAMAGDKLVTVSPATSLAKVILGCGFYYDRGEMMRRTLSTIDEFFSHDIHGIRRFGAAALDLCMVGCGQFGGFFEYKLSPWDFAAGRLFVEEAGGKVTDAVGDPLSMKPTSIVASNGQLHEAMLEITRRHQG